MKKLILTVVASLLCVQSYGANWYINSAVGTSGAGTSWSTAWKTPGAVVWSSVNPGDTIWIAGGTYTAGFVIRKSGSAALPITIKRATVNDATATSAAGWSAGYDSQVVVDTGTPCWWDTLNLGSYLYFDGRTTNGIHFKAGSTSFGTCALFFSAGGMHDLTFTNMDLSGPAGSAAFTYGGDCAVIGMRPSIGGGGVISYLTVVDANIHGSVNLVYNLGGNHHFNFIRTKFYDNYSANAATFHPNMIYTGGQNTEWTFAYCEFFNWQVEGINLYQQTSNPHYFYGCIFRDALPGARCFWLANESLTPTGPIYLYNNTFVGVSITIGESRASMAAPGSQARNNIYWNSTFAGVSSITDSDYNFGTGTIPGAHSISAGSNPFINESLNDFRIVATIGTKFPRDKGIILASPYDKTADGLQRGSDGFFDIGAFEYGAGGGSTNAPNPTITLSAASKDYGLLKVGSLANYSLLISNSGGGSFSGTATVPAPFSITSGASYTLFGGSNLTIGIRYTPVAQGSYSNVVTLTGGGGATFQVTGKAYENQTGFTWWATNGLVTSPMTLAGGIASHSADSSDAVPSDGYLLFGFSAPTNGLYYFTANVRATNTSNDSLYFNVDTVPTYPANIWDVLPVTTGVQSRTISQRGNGTFNAPQYPTNIYSLSAGDHTAIFYYREPYAGISNLTLRGFSTNSPGTPPSFISSPQNLRVIQAVSTNLSATAVGTLPLTYLWFKNSTFSTLGATLIFPSTSDSDEGDYFVVCTNTSGSATSQVATVTVVNPPTITVNPTNVTWLKGTPLTVYANGTDGDGTAQKFWYRNGVEVQGQNSNVLTLDPADFVDSSSWTYVLRNEYGTAYSTTNRITIVSEFNISAPRFVVRNAFFR